ncbi:MAG TPA: DUF5916 domain-containing protein [Longimicrobiaceae bacterium]|nr:DUF5916 domain-containing protein [Longimicrobiaceae bacterium]
MRRLLLSALCVPGLASAQAPSPRANIPVPATHPAPILRAAPATQPIRIDGRLDEETWLTAAPATEFTQIVPSEGAPATQRTEVRILFDRDALYIGARLEDTEPVSTRLVRRDGPMDRSDWLTVILDSYHDHRTAFAVELNPSGVRRDQIRAGGSEDDSWDPVWEAATAVDSSGWTAEMRIPFSQLRFNPGSDQVWGIQIERSRARNQEFTAFAFTPSTEPGGIPRYGHLHDLRTGTARKRLEILPYTLARGEDVDRGDNPFRADRDLGISAGLDLKYRATSDLTLDLTLNPDFGQVEVDPAEVNLTDAETRYQEKRPFFIEGADIFRFGAGGNDVFYSRRIGRAPQLSPAGTAVDAPNAAHILGAGKLSGRTRSGWAIGALSAVTGRTTARYLAVDGRADDMTVEPLTSYFAARLRRDARSGQSVVGGMFTAVNRRLDSDVLRSTLHSAAYSGGVDFVQQWANRTWTLSGFGAGSYVSGTPEALVRTQQAPRRYFQRPDARAFQVDSSATSLAGLATQLDLQHRRGRHWRYGATVRTTTPGFEINDLGYQDQANRVESQARITYVENRPGRWLRYWDVTGRSDAGWNFDGDRTLGTAGLQAGLQTLGYWRAFAGLTVTAASHDDRLTRGGPVARRPGTVRGSVVVVSDQRRPVRAMPSASYVRDDLGGWGGSAVLDVAARPAPGWSVSLAPGASRRHSAAQFLETIPDPSAEHTFGSRYVFAPLDQTTVWLETRVNVTFTPTLSLQVYAQPFLSSQAFGHPAELAAARTSEFRTYGTQVGSVVRDGATYTIFPLGRSEGAPSFELADPDFNFRSLRGNAILRWEWRPGSTLYVAWQQLRNDVAPVGDFAFGRDRSALFAARPDNVLVVKMSYWLNP